jgi:hypothetical protein
MSLSASMWKSLFECCRSAQTGSLFIATKENKAGQIVINEGRLVGIAYAGLTNEEAVRKLEEVGELRFSFTPQIQFPLKEVLPKEQAHELLEAMGYSVAQSQERTGVKKDVSELAQQVLSEGTFQGSDSNPDQMAHADALWETTKAGSTERLYRGHKILEDAKPRKPTERLYRGQRIVVA